MASQVALMSFDTIQLGREAVAGTLVPATRRLVGKGFLKEIEERYYSDYPRGLLTTVGGVGETVARWCEFEFESQLCPQEMLWAILTGLKGNITPSAAGAAITWAVPLGAAQLNLVPTLDTMTIEMALTDGTTNHVYAEAGYGMITGYSIEWAFNQVAKVTMTGFARARQTGSPTAALVPYANRQILNSALAKVFLDTTYAGIGGTQLTTVVRSAKIEVDTFPRPDFTIDGLADKDFSSHRVAPFRIKGSLVAELNATMATQFTNWRANTQRPYFRYDSAGITLGAATYLVRHDVSARYIGTPEMSDDDGQRLVTLNWEGVYDDTATKIADISVVCDLTALAGL